MATVAERLRDTADRVADMLPAATRDTLFLRAAGLFKIPMLLYVRPRVLQSDDQRCAVRIPLRRRTKNHVGSMYFGVLAAGADCSGGLMAMRRIHRARANVVLLFKDFKAEFLKRAEGDCVFTCEDGDAIGELVDRAQRTGKRVNGPVRVTATCPAQLGDEPVARFVLTLSLKRRG